MYIQFIKEKNSNTGRELRRRQCSPHVHSHLTTCSIYLLFFLYLSIRCRQFVLFVFFTGPIYLSYQQFVYLEGNRSYSVKQKTKKKKKKKKSNKNISHESLSTIQISYETPLLYSILVCGTFKYYTY